MTQEMLVEIKHATKLYYKNKDKHSYKSYLKFNQLEKDIIVKDISIELYRGEIMGIIGDQNSEKEMIGQLITKEIKPSLGEVTNKFQTFYADVNKQKDDAQSIKDMIEKSLVLLNVSLKEIDNKREEILTIANINDKQNEKCNSITSNEYAQLLLAMAIVIKPIVTVFNNIIGNLSEEYQLKLNDFFETQIKEERAAVLIDEHLHSIERYSNYLIWMTYGQVRATGQVKEVLAKYRDYQKKYNLINTQEQRDAYDLKWKKNLQVLPMSKGNKMKRLNKYEYSIFPKNIEKFILYGVLFLFGLLLSALLMINNIGTIDSATDKSHTQVISTANDGEGYTNKSAYILTLKPGVELKQEKGNKHVALPEYSFLNLTGENQEKYRLEVSGKTYISNKNNVYYFNQAGLYEDVDWADLEEFVDNNYLNYIDYYNSFINKTRQEVHKTISAEKNNRFREKIQGQNVSLLYDSNENLTGFTFNIKNKDKLVKKYNISNNVWIVKSREGYMMADIKNDKWIFIRF